MDSWNDIVHTAMLGTEKKQLSLQALPGPLQDALQKLNESGSGDREEQFLQIASLVFNYQQAGLVPERISNPAYSTAPAEEKSYCSKEATIVLRELIAEEIPALLKIWLQKAKEKELLADPSLVPALLEQAVYRKELRPLVAACCGKRGEWLAGFNGAWNFSVVATAEEQWLTGTPEQRRGVLKELRRKEPGTAVLWLQKTWAEEDAATKQSFLEILAEDPNEGDIAFLEGLVSEKSKKVKEQAMELLRCLPASQLVQSYQNYLQQTITLKKERALLGLSSKQTLEFKADAAALPAGIDKLSSNKELTDEEYILSQLIQATPLPFWQNQLGLAPRAVIDFLQKDVLGKKMIPFFILSVVRFRDKAWAQQWMEHGDVFYIDLIPLLPADRQDQYSNRFFDDHADAIIRHACAADKQWSRDLTLRIFRYAALRPYQYNRSFYTESIDLIPPDIVDALEKCTPDETNRQTWSNTSDHIIKLISLKIRIIEAFAA